MNLDLTKAILYTQYDAFKNNNIFTGSFTISGATTAGANTRTFTVDLGITPDMTDVIFNGPATSVDPRPDNAWFKRGSIEVLTNNAGGGNPSSWELTTSINGTTVTITATFIQSFVTSETLTPTSFSYRIIDYSVF